MLSYFFEKNRKYWSNIPPESFSKAVDKRVKQKRPAEDAGTQGCGLSYHGLWILFLKIGRTDFEKNKFFQKVIRLSNASQKQ